MFRTIKFIYKIIKEILIMIFKQDSQIVRSYVILILAGKMTFDEVPDLYNLREMVKLVLES